MAVPDRFAWPWQTRLSGAAARRARLAMGVLLSLMGLALAVLVLTPVLHTDARGFAVVLVTLALLSLSYGLVRVGHVTLGTAAAVLGLEVAIWLSRLGAAHPEGQATLYYLGVALLLAGLLLPARSAAAVAVATVLAAWALEASIDGRFGTGFGAEDTALMVFLAAVAALAVAASAILQRDARELEVSREQLRQLSDNIPEVFFIVAPDLRRAHYASPAYEKVWGRSVARFLEDPLDWLKGVHPDDLPRVEAALRAQPGGPLAFRIVHPGGAVRHIRSQTFPVVEGGRVVRLVGIAADVTEMEEANRRLRAAAEERQRMFRQVAHDLANPLSPIAMHTALLEHAQLPEKPRHSVAVIRRNAEQLRRHVEDLRDLARIEGGGLRLAPAPVDLGALAREVAESFQEEAATRGVRLALEAEEAMVVADRSRIAQVLYNLLSNALKFTPSGGTVTLRAGRQGVAVRDSGRGLSPEEAARLFQPFSQVHDPGEVKERGTGLGLFICKGIVEAHGGRIEVRSAGRGHGSTFAFELPRAA